MTPGAPAPVAGVVLALGGGGALGWAHIGVLRALIEHEVPIVAAAGTSIGAIAAVSFAAGELDALERIARGMHRRRAWALVDPTLARGALLGGRRVLRQLARHFADRTFADLPIPVATVAADLATGEEVRLTGGGLVDAVRASIAIPSVFSPVARDGRLLIDGGMVANLPVAAARALAPGRPVVAVDLMGDYRGFAARAGRPIERGNALTMGRAGFLMLIGAQGRLTIALERPEVVIRLPIGHLASSDFHRAEELIALGHAAAIDALPQIGTALAAIAA